MSRRRNPVRNATKAAKVALTEATETIVATLSGVTTDVENALITLAGTVTVKTGKESTGVVVRIRRGTTAEGTEVAKATLDAITAEKTYPVTIEAMDRQEGELAGASYVLTVTNTAAKAAGEAVEADLQATY